MLPDHPRWYLRHGPLLVAAAVVLVFANTLPNTLAMDDYYRVASNPGIQSIWPPWRHFVDPGTISTTPLLVQYRPLLPLTLSFDYALWGESVAGFRGANILWQIVAALVVLALARELLLHWMRPALSRAHAEGAALAAALLFAVHPIAGLAVNYISARDLLIMQVTVFGALLLYIRLRRMAPTGAAAVRTWSAMLLLVAASMLSKQNGVVFPVLTIAFDVLCAGDRLASRGPWLRALPFAGVIAAFFAWTNWGLGFSDLDNVVSPATSPWVYALTQIKLHATDYLRFFVWPFDMRPFPAFEHSTSLLDPGVVAGGIVIGATLLLAWYLRRRAPVSAFAILAYWILMSVESSVVPLVNVSIHYRPYPSSPFFWIAVVLGAAALLRRRQPRLAPAVAVAAVLATAATSFAMNRNWRTEESLWKQSVRYGADYRGHLNYATSIRDASDPRVTAHLDTALALMFGGTRVSDLKGDGAVISEIHLDAQAFRDTTRANIHFWRAYTHREFGRFAEARVESEIAARLAPEILSYQWYAANDAQQAGDWERVLEFANVIEGLDPGRGSTAFLAGFALQNLGRVDAAIGRYERYLALPDSQTSPGGRTQVEVNLAFALTAQGRCAEALPYLERITAARPEDAAAKGLMEACRAR